MDNYLVILSSGWTRDIQLCRSLEVGAPSNWDKEDLWEDTEGDIVMGTILADSATEAIDLVSTIEGIHREAFSAVQIPYDFDISCGYYNPRFGNKE